MFAQACVTLGGFLNFTSVFDSHSFCNWPQLVELRKMKVKVWQLALSAFTLISQHET